jgi:hypothetical protein
VGGTASVSAADGRRGRGAVAAADGGSVGRGRRGAGQRVPAGSAGAAVAAAERGAAAVVAVLGGRDAVAEVVVVPLCSRRAVVGSGGVGGGGLVRQGDGQQSDENLSKRTTKICNLRNKRNPVRLKLFQTQFHIYPFLYMVSYSLLYHMIISHVCFI